MKQWIKAAGIRAIKTTAQMAITLSIIACLLTPTIAQAATYQGADRYETAALIAIESGAKDITIVSGENFPDALSAINLGNPVLLVKADEIPQATAEALLTIVPDSITIVGGEAVVSKDVATQLETYIKPIYAKIKGDGSHADLRVTLHPKATRIAGADRYETNSLTINTDTSTVTCVNGECYADAISATNISNNAYPLALIRYDSIPTAVANKISEISPEHINIVGGTAVVSEQVGEELYGYIVTAPHEGAVKATVNRIAGNDRYATNLLTIGDFSTLNVVTGKDFPDALAAAFVGDQTLLFDGQQLPDWCLNAMEYNFIGGVDKEAFEAIGDGRIKETK